MRYPQDEQEWLIALSRDPIEMAKAWSKQTIGTGPTHFRRMCQLISALTSLGETSQAVIEAERARVSELERELERVLAGDPALIAELEKAHGVEATRWFGQVNLQQLHDAGLNPFSVQLLTECVTRRKDKTVPFKPVSFVYNGVRITMGEEVDGTPSSA